jgi:hypothetical protein
MQSTRRGWCSTPVAAFALGAILACPSSVRSTDNPGGETGILYCGDEGIAAACLECDKGGVLACCDYDMGERLCTVSPDPPPTALESPVDVKFTGAGLLIQCEVDSAIRNGELVVSVSLRETIVATSPPKRIATLKARLTGPDAMIAGLLYPVAFLAFGTSAADVLQQQGYDVSVAITGSPLICHEGLSTNQGCPQLATQLSKSIDAVLAVGTSNPRRDQFLRGVEQLGYPPCQIVC